MEGLALAGAGTGAPPLAIEGRRAVGRSGWHQNGQTPGGGQGPGCRTRAAKGGRTNKERR